MGSSGPGSRPNLFRKGSSSAFSASARSGVTSLLRSARAVVEKGLILIFFICISPLITYYRAGRRSGTEAAKIFSRVRFGMPMRQRVPFSPWKSRGAQYRGQTTLHLVPGGMSPRQQLMRMLRRTPRVVGIADTVPATLLAQVLAQQLAGARIEQPNVHRVPLHMDLTPDPARRRSVVSRFNFDAAIQVHRALAVLVVAKRLQRQRLQKWLFFAEHRCHFQPCPCNPDRAPCKATL